MVTADATGMHYAPLPALETLHEEYHFWRHHSLAAGTEQTLTQISAFGARAHIRVQPSGLPRRFVGGTEFPKVPVDPERPQNCNCMTI